MMMMTEDRTAAADVTAWTEDLQALPQAFICFGLGDVVKRFCLPALFKLWMRRATPSMDDEGFDSTTGSPRRKFWMLFVNRTDKPVEEMRNELGRACEATMTGRGEDFSWDHWRSFATRIFHYCGDATKSESFPKLAEFIAEQHRGNSTGGKNLIYIATPPGCFEPILRNMAANNLHGTLVIEKPLGRDLAEMQRVNQLLKSEFAEDQVLRLDHYLGKEGVQNIVVTRSDPFVRHAWHVSKMRRIEIVASETMGVNGREYDGAWRDFYTHLLLVAGLIGAEAPPDDSPKLHCENASAMWEAAGKFLKTLTVKRAIRGQYLRATIGRQPCPGFIDELRSKHGSLDSLPNPRLETYAGVSLTTSLNPNLEIYLVTGKRLPVKRTQAFIDFGDGRGPLFNIGPRAELRMIHSVKRRGSRLSEQPGDFIHTPTGTQGQSEQCAYEILFTHAMRGIPHWFAPGAIMEQCAAIATPLLDHWQNSTADICDYEADTWPAQQIELTGHVPLQVVTESAE